MKFEVGKIYERLNGELVRVTQINEGLTDDGALEVEFLSRTTLEPVYKTTATANGQYVAHEGPAQGHDIVREYEPDRKVTPSEEFVPEENAKITDPTTEDVVEDLPWDGTPVPVSPENVDRVEDIQGTEHEADFFDNLRSVTEMFNKLSPCEWPSALAYLNNRYALKEIV